MYKTHVSHSTKNTLPSGVILPSHPEGISVISSPGPRPQYAKVSKGTGNGGNTSWISIGSIIT